VDAEVVVLEAEEACRLLYVGDDGDVYQSNFGSPTRKLTWGWNELSSSDRLHYVWPAFSPDGSQVACFGVRSGSVPEASLYTVANDGIRMSELWRMTEASAPVCESWSPDSRSIAILLQGKDELHLEVASVDRPGRTTLVDRGAPLFWSWSPRASYLAVHTGGSSSIYEDARLSVFQIGEGAADSVASQKSGPTSSRGTRKPMRQGDTPMRQGGTPIRKLVELTPGEFRTPTWSPDGSRLAYVDASDPAGEYLALYRLDDGSIDVMLQVHGQTAMLWSPDGRTLALSQALGDSPHVYSGITLVDVETGEARLVDDSEIVSFFWAPCSKRLVTMAFDHKAGMCWTVIETHGCEKRRLGSNFYPSRELVYFSWFFDQFAVSHPPISADGTRLVFAGHMGLEGNAPIASRAQSNVYVASLIDTGRVDRVASGHFACWDARMRSAPA
jgi:dipeptidyl aminopeptidase/acylaminoacyl peptidase